MKTKITTLVLLFLFACVGLAQDSVKTEKLNNFINTFKPYSQKSFWEYKKLRSVDYDSIKEVVKVIYEAIECAPIEVNSIERLDKKMWEDDLKKNKNNPPSVEPCGFVIRHFTSMIEEKYPPLISALTSIPIFVKAKIESIDTGIVDVKIGKNSISHIKKLIAKLNIEDVVKGNMILKGKHEFSTYYCYWENVAQENDYKIGKSYLFPLWNRDPDDKPAFAVATYLDKHGARFLVANDILYDYYNIFGLGKEVKWTDFVNAINDKIYRIKNMLDY